MVFTIYNAWFKKNYFQVEIENFCLKKKNYHFL